MSLAGFDLWALFGGLVAYGVAVLMATLLVFGLFRINALIDTRVEEEKLLAGGHRSLAVSLGAVLLCQAVLLRHALFPIMVVVRGALVERRSLGSVLVAVGQSAAFLVVVAAVSVGSVLVAGRLFTWMTGGLSEADEIRNDNVAVAIFYAFALVSITLILDQGVEDLARSIVPYGPSGILHLP